MARILVIDDDPQMRATLRRILATSGHVVMEASNGREGMATFQSNAVDVVVTDIIMPEKEGIETIIALRRLAPGTRILAVSGGGQTAKTDFLSVAKKLGADSVLAKPVRAANLVAAIDALVAPAEAKVS